MGPWPRPVATGTAAAPAATRLGLQLRRLEQLRTATTALRQRTTWVRQRLRIAGALSGFMAGLGTERTVLALKPRRVCVVKQIARSAIHVIGAAHRVPLTEG